MSSLSQVPRSILDFAEAWVPSHWDPVSGTWDFGTLHEPRAVINVSAYPHAPFIVGSANATWPFTGPFVRALDSICWTLDYLCKVSLASYGSSKNDSLNGVLGELFFGRAQLGIAALTVNPSRATAFDMIESPFNRIYQVIIHDCNTYTERAGSLFDSLFALFDPAVWLVMTVMFVSTRILFWMMRKLQMRRYGNPLSSSADRKADVGNWIFATRLSIGSKDARRRRKWLMSERMQVAVWAIWSVIISAILSSQLLWILASGRLRQSPFSTVDELVATDYTVYGTSNMKWSFSADRRENMQRLGKGMQEIAASVDNYAVFVDRILRSGRVAVVISEDNHFDLAAVSCHLVIAIPRISPHPIAAFVFPKQSAMRKVFENQYNKIVEVGLVQADYTYFAQLFRTSHVIDCLPRTLPNRQSSRKDGSDFSTFSFTDIAPLAGSALTGLALAWLMFGLECAAERWLLDRTSCLTNNVPSSCLVRAREGRHSTEPFGLAEDSEGQSDGTVRNALF